MKKITFGLGATALLFGACAEGPQSTTDDFGYEGTGIQVSIAPLTLDSLSDACYSFEIRNELDDTVVARGPESSSAGSGNATANSVCASRFGNGDGGDISYVAPCDAQEPLHTVTLWVDALCVGDDLDPTGTPGTSGGSSGTICEEMQDYVDPCPDGCSLNVKCQENADTPVTFNFTIMGQADQGFFDVAVNFDDVFCSAKVDTCNTEDDAIQLVFDGDGNRMDTVVAAIACTAGEGTRTHLQHTALVFDCGDGVIANINPADVDEEGNQGSTNGIPWAAYFGLESLPNVSKVYSNFAFGIPAGATCNLSWAVVPSNGEFADPSDSNTYNSFGYVNFNVKDITPVETSEDCQVHPLDGDGSGVTTVYATTAGEDDSTPDLLSLLSGQDGGTDILPWPSTPVSDEPEFDLP